MPFVNYANGFVQVNMAGTLQLAYLGTLVLSSIGEILVIGLVRNIQYTAIHYGSAHFLMDNEFWSKAIIRAALETDDTFSLASLPWCEIGLLPGMTAFRNLCELLPELRGPIRVAMSKDVVRARLSKNVEGTRMGLVDRLVEEIEEARIKKASSASSHAPKSG
jgi:hypothetical protein